MDQQDLVIRFYLVLRKKWIPQLEDKTSATFSQISTQLSLEMEKLFLNVRGKQVLTVVEFRQDIYTLLCIVGLGESGVCRRLRVIKLQFYI